MALNMLSFSIQTLELISLCRKSSLRTNDNFDSYTPLIDTVHGWKK